MQHGLFHEHKASFKNINSYCSQMFSVYIKYERKIWNILAFFNFSGIFTPYTVDFRSVLTCHLTVWLYHCSIDVGSFLFVCLFNWDHQHSPMVQMTELALWKCQVLCVHGCFVIHVDWIKIHIPLFCDSKYVFIPSELQWTALFKGSGICWWSGSVCRWLIKTPNQTTVISFLLSFSKNHLDNVLSLNGVTWETVMSIIEFIP